jgi:beta-lactamase superfamily II metal-dependent hydrolase
MSIIKSFSVGSGDMFYIKHGSDNFTIIDCCMSDDHRSDIVKELKSESKGKGITRFISTHPDDDHIHGLDYLDEEMNFLNFYCVKNKATKDDETNDFNKYCELRDDSEKSFYIYRDCSRRWMNESNDERGSAGINILWPITSNKHFKEALEEAEDGENPNNISPIIKYSFTNGVTMLWMGDLENVFMENIKDEITLPKVDILFAPHHGRSSGKVPEDWLDECVPEIIIVGEAPSKDLEYYTGYNTITQNTAGDIVFECDTGKVHIYVSNSNYSINFLDDEDMDTYDYYIGTLNL